MPTWGLSTQKRDRRGIEKGPFHLRAAYVRGRTLQRVASSLSNRREEVCRTGVITEQNIIMQLKKEQGETNQRLDAILEELRRLNANLERLSATPAGTR
jgi:hypothetical protein